MAGVSDETPEGHRRVFRLRRATMAECGPVVEWALERVGICSGRPRVL